MLNWDIFKDFKKGLSRRELSKKYSVKEWLLRALYNIKNYAIPEALILVLSDLHFGSIDMPDDFEENFFSNLKHVLDNIIYKNIDEVIIFELGDIIDNILHSTQRENNPPIDLAITRAKKFFRDLIRLLEPDKLYYVVGNHDRLTKDLTDKHYITLEIYSDLEYELELLNINTQLIKVNFPEIIKIKDWNIILTHGTFFKTLSGEVSGLTIKRMIADILHLTETYNPDGSINKIEFIFMGHIHKLINYRALGVEVFINGTSHRKKFHQNNIKTEDLGQWLLTLPPKSFCIKNNKLRPTIGTSIKVWCE